jgi:hypothetical protein
MGSPAFKGIYISNPCHENWDAMEETQKGRFCLNCREVVHDFTNLSENDLNNLLKNNKGNLCGRFYEDQIEINTRSVQAPEGLFSKALNHIYSIWAFIVFNLVTFNETNAFNTKAEQVQTVSDVKEQNQVEGDSIHFSGRVVNQKNQAIPAANIELKDKSGKVILSCQSDQNGEFLFSSNSPLPQEDLVLRVQKKHREKGYSINSEKTISLKKSNCNNLLIKINLHKGKRSKLRMTKGKVRRKFPSNLL